jgi:hypothetical protein
VRVAAIGRQEPIVEGNDPGVLAPLAAVQTPTPFATSWTTQSMILVRVPKSEMPPRRLTAG